MSATKKPVSVSFHTTLSAVRNNTGIEVPDGRIAELGAAKRPAVVVNVNGYEYRNTVGVMGGKHLVSVSAAIRKESGLRGGDAIHVTLTLADSPREIEIPADFETALAASVGRRKVLHNPVEQPPALSRRRNQRGKDRRKPTATH
jgi:Domain of unknown function (DUF1905)